MRLKIVSGGTSYNTRVIDADTGEDLKYVKSVTWGVTAGKGNPLCTATITLFNVPVELVTEAELERENLDGTVFSVLEVGLENRDGTTSSNT